MDVRFGSGRVSDPVQGEAGAGGAGIGDHERAVIETLASARRRIHSVPDVVLERYRHGPTTVDRAEDLLIALELMSAVAESRDLCDVRARLDEWRQAERALDACPRSAAGRDAVEDCADIAREAFHQAESLQRLEHGLRDRRRHVRSSTLIALRSSIAR